MATEAHILEILIKELKKGNWVKLSNSFFSVVWLSYIIPTQISRSN